MPKQRRLFIRTFSILLLFVTLLTGCGSSTPPDNEDAYQPLINFDLMLDIPPAPVPERLPDSEFISVYRDFAVNLFKAANIHDQNIVISPFCIMNSLTLLANGAIGKSQTEITQTFGKYIQPEELNAYMATYTNILSQEYNVKTSSSVWINGLDDSCVPEKTFLQTNADYYLGNAYLLDFSTNYSYAVSEWLKNSAGLSYPENIEPLTDNSSVSFLGAFTGNSTWKIPFAETSQGTFTVNEEVKHIKCMVSNENAYISLGYASGFLKPLDNGMSVAFIKPEFSIDIDYVIDSLSGSRLENLFNSVSYDYCVKVSIPEFSRSDLPDIKTALSKCGIKTAFDKDLANIQNILKSNTKTYISHIAAPVSIVFNAQGFSFNGSACTPKADVTAPENTNPVKEINFDSPFLYILFDNYGSPVLLGKVASI